MLLLRKGKIQEDGLGKNQVRTWGSDGAQRSSAFCPRHPQPGGAQLECELGSAWLESSSPSYTLLNSDDPRLQRACLPPLQSSRCPASTAPLPLFLSQAPAGPHLGVLVRVHGALHAEGLGAQDLAVPL